MIRWLIRSSLKFRRLVVAIAAVILVLGVAQLREAPVDMLPEFEPVQVEVQTEALGLSAAEVEQLITVPLEQDLLNGVAFLERIESTSLPGLSSVVMTFEEGTPILAARQVVQERLTQAHALPHVSQPPQMLQPLSSTSRIAMVRISSEQLSQIQLSVLARWNIRPRLMGVDGVANVSVWGMRDRQLQVLVDPARLHGMGVTVGQVVSTTANALWWCPLTFEPCSTPGVGGFIDGPTQRIGVHHESPIKTPADLSQVPLEDGNGGALDGVHLGDVADVVVDHPPLIGDVTCEGCLLLVIEKLPGANTAEVTSDIDEALQAMRPGLGDVQIDASIYRPAAYIDDAFSRLGWAIVVGSILMLLAVAVLTWQWRRALLVAVVVAVSLTTAALALVLTDTTINLIIVAGLTLALAVVIDDGVIEGDALARRLREQQGTAQPLWRTILDAAQANRSAILIATLIGLVVVVPAYFLEGEAGAFLPPIATAYAVAVAASMLTALTVAPALGMMLMPGAVRTQRSSPVVGWLQARYDGLAGRSIANPGVAIAVLVIAVLVTLVAVPTMQTSMRPQLQESDVLITWAASPGTSLPMMQDSMGEAVAAIQAIDGVEGVDAHIGRAVMSDQIVNVDSGQLWARLSSDADRGSTLTAIEDALDGYPDVTTEVTTYSESRITEVLEREDDDIVVRIYGEDGETVLDRAEAVRAEILEVDGVTTAEVDAEPTEPTLEIRVDLDRAEAYGVKPGDVRRAAATLLSGLSVGALFEEQKVFDVVVWGTPSIRESVGDAKNLLIDLPTGAQVRLDQVADVVVRPNPAAIHHESVSKFVDVSATVAGRDLTAVATDIEAAIDDIEFGLDYHAEVLGGYADELAASTRARVIAAAALIAVFLLLQAAFGSWRLAVLAFLTLPMAVAGGAIAVTLIDGELTLGSAAGLAAVFGFAARQLVLTVRLYQRRGADRREAADGDTTWIREATLERFPAIVTSAVAIAAMLLPIAVLSGTPAFELVGPLAIAMIGGLVTTVAMSLVVLPALYGRYGVNEVADDAGEDITVAIPELETTQGGA